MKRKDFWLLYLFLILASGSTALILSIIPENYRFFYGLASSILFLLDVFLIWYHGLVAIKEFWALLFLVIVGAVGLVVTLERNLSYWILLVIGLISTQLTAVVVLKISKRKIVTN